MTDYEPGPNQAKINKKQDETNRAQIKFGEALVTDMESRQDNADSYASDVAEMREGEYAAQQTTNTEQELTNRELRVSNREARQALDEVRVAAENVTSELSLNVRTNHKQIRILAAVVAFMFLLGIGTVLGFRQLARDRQRTNDQQARSAMIVAHGGCLRLNDGRHLFATAIADTIHSVYGFNVNKLPRKPEVQAAIDGLLLHITARNNELLRPVNCDVAAPMPPHPTKAEIARLPKPTKIPPEEGP